MSFHCGWMPRFLTLRNEAYRVLLSTLPVGHAPDLAVARVGPRECACTAVQVASPVPDTPTPALYGVVTEAMEAASGIAKPLDWRRELQRRKAALHAHDDDDGTDEPVWLRKRREKAQSARTEMRRVSREEAAT